MKLFQDCEITFLELSLEPNSLPTFTRSFYYYELYTVFSRSNYAINLHLTFNRFCVSTPDSTHTTSTIYNPIWQGFYQIYSKPSYRPLQCSALIAIPALHFKFKGISE